MRTDFRIFIVHFSLLLISCSPKDQEPSLPDAIYVGEVGVGLGNMDFVSKRFIDKNSIKYYKNDSGEQIARYWEIEFVSKFERNQLIAKDKKFQRLKLARTQIEINCDRQAYNASTQTKQYLDDTGNILEEIPPAQAGLLDVSGAFTPWVPITQQYPVWWKTFHYLCQ